MVHTEMKTASLIRYALLAVLLTVTGLSCADAEDQLLADVYSNGGQTLYCKNGCVPSGRVK